MCALPPLFEKLQVFTFHCGWWPPVEKKKLNILE